MRHIRPIFLAAALLLTACGDDGGGDDATTTACERWDAIQGTQTSDADAAAELNEIADLSTNTNVSDKAEALAIALEGSATQTEIGQAYEDMDAACQAATG
jgi:hypothetical protein